jgi:hypothetical protein
MKKSVTILLAICSLSLFAINTNYEGSALTKINTVYGYSEFGGGDVYFKLDENSANCSGGYWMRKSDPGFNTTLSMVLAAYQAKTQLVVYGLIDESWAGTSVKTCRLYSISYRN